jgi:hypothetical protein
LPWAAAETIGAAAATPRNERRDMELCVLMVRTISHTILELVFRRVACRRVPVAAMRSAGYSYLNTSVGVSRLALRAG